LKEEGKVLKYVWDGQLGCPFLCHIVAKCDVLDCWVSTSPYSVVYGCIANEINSSSFFRIQKYPGLESLFLAGKLLNGRFRVGY
jgi:hypothetical protein